MPIPSDIMAYNAAQAPVHRRICDALAKLIAQQLPAAESKIWHRHPVWFLADNPIVGYSPLKHPTPSIRLLFWSGQSFDEPGLAPEGSFKAAEARYTDVAEISIKDLKRWLAKATEIQWDYKNIVKRKGRLERISTVPWQAETLEQVRALIKQALPEVVEEIKWRKPSNPNGVPVWSLPPIERDVTAKGTKGAKAPKGGKGNSRAKSGGIIFSGEAYKEVVKLTFARGASLPDPSGLFNSSLEGNTRRAIDIRAGESIKAKPLLALIKAAARELRAREQK